MTVNAYTREGHAMHHRVAYGDAFAALLRWVERYIGESLPRPLSISGRIDRDRAAMTIIDEDGNLLTITVEP